MHKSRNLWSHRFCHLVPTSIVLTNVSRCLGKETTTSLVVLSAKEQRKEASNSTLQLRVKCVRDLTFLFCLTFWQHTHAQARHCPPCKFAKHPHLTDATLDYFLRFFGLGCQRGAEHFLFCAPFPLWTRFFRVILLIRFASLHRVRLQLLLPCRHGRLFCVRRVD